MSILLLEAAGIKKSFADKTILDVKLLRIYEGNKIGFIGANGLGKSTLLDILAGVSEPDEGVVRRYCDVAYMRQFGVPEVDTQHFEENSIKKLSEYKVLEKAESDNVSGGELTRLKLAYALGSDRRLVFADEPTSNLDAGGIEQFGKELSALDSFIIVSHDRSLLNNYCNMIMTIEDLDVKFYDGGYDAYRQITDERRRRAELEFEKYEEEKGRLQNVYADKKAKALKAVKKPNKLSNEIKQRGFTAARRSFDGKQRGFDSAARSVQARIDQMEVKEKPARQQVIKINFSLTDPPQNKVVLSGNEVNFAYGENVIFDGASFMIRNGARVALCGENGSGKTTLFNMIDRGDPQIYRVPKARIGYFYQGFENLDNDKTVLQNILSDGIQTESVARSVLSRLLFGRGEVGKLAGVLSGGERVKLGLAKLLVSRNNVLMLDEPTNYLDMPSIEALQNILSEYEGTLLFVSHDREFVNAVCTELLIIKDKKTASQEGGLI